MDGSASTAAWRPSDTRPTTRPERKHPELVLDNLVSVVRSLRAGTPAATMCPVRRAGTGSGEAAGPARGWGAVELMRTTVDHKGAKDPRHRRPPAGRDHRRG